jgi:four helix bundle protein
VERRPCAYSKNLHNHREFSAKDKIQFYSIAQGSLTELQNQLLIARDIGYIKEDEFKIIAEETVIVSKLVNGLKRIRDTRY